MTLTVAVQMDPIQRIKIAGDSTFAMLLEAQRRGHQLLHYTPDRLTMRDGAVTAMAEPIEVARRRGRSRHAWARPSGSISPTVDVVLLRQDPPFDMAYITTTHLLERIHPKTLVVNDPTHVRNAPEKLFVTQFPHLMPPTLISRDKAEIEEFRHEHGEVVMKPLYGNGGAAVFKVSREDPNFGSLFDLFATFPRAMGDPAVPAEDHRRRQAHHPHRRRGGGRHQPRPGAQRHPLQHGARRRRKADRPDPARDRNLRDDRAELKEMGQIFVGIDVIDGNLTEINVTSPTGIRAIKRLAVPIWRSCSGTPSSRSSTASGGELGDH